MPFGRSRVFPKALELMQQPKENKRGTVAVEELLRERMTTVPRWFSCEEETMNFMTCMYFQKIQLKLHSET
ncbi:hypothetical protein OPV22_023899 [Ensete ventricosum]|uniref:Uncharacterized protein n=1 Tax=Ensete ventricosum TaxID=4639 RepID=A0AAV8QWL3_ENSVE|nr:hypothetical protein OPV22_023899 [Ensete ventricosum]